MSWEKALPLCSLVLLADVNKTHNLATLTITKKHLKGRNRANWYFRGECILLPLCFS